MTCRCGACADCKTREQARLRQERHREAENFAKPPRPLFARLDPTECDDWIEGVLAAQEADRRARNPGSRW